MKSKNRAEITIETHRFLRIRQGPQTFSEWCRECCRWTGRVTADEAAIVAGVGKPMIFKRLEERTLHFIETQAGEVLICIHSLGDMSSDTTRAAFPNDP
ncbi:MAG: hypothetical protein ABI857_01865 [Acidobacteriota bacterium]